MKSILVFALMASFGLNVFLAKTNSDLHTSLASEASVSRSYKALLDSQDAEYEERADIARIIAKRNKHVPSLIIDQWAGAIQQASQHYSVDSRILLSLFKIESAMVHYDSRGNLTVSHKGAGGLGQIMPFWAKACPHSDRTSDLNNGTVNIMCSAYILRHYLDSNDNDMFFALTAYNGGPNGVRLMKKGRDITDRYAAKILWKYQEDKSKYTNTLI